MHWEKLISILVMVYSLETLAISIDPRYVYPITMADASGFLLPTSRKTLNHRPQKFSAPDSSEPKYLIFVKPTVASSSNQDNEESNEDSIEYRPKAQLKHLPNLKQLPEIYSTSLSDRERFLGERPRFRAQEINSQRYRLSMALGHQAERGGSAESRLPKKLSRTRGERLVRKEPLLENNQGEDEDDIAGNDGRIAYQVHGFGGPKAYKFGYDTGRGKDRHFHNEESNPSGLIKGRYGFINPKGRHTVVKYTASPEGGFRIEKVI